jgi:hypothetical protein
MKENISVEAGKCCTHSLNETFRSVIRQVLFLRYRQVLRIWANSSLPPGAPCPERILVHGRSHNG